MREDRDLLQPPGFRPPKKRAANVWTAAAPNFNWKDIFQKRGPWPNLHPTDLKTRWQNTFRKWALPENERKEPGRRADEVSFVVLERFIAQRASDNHGANEESRKAKAGRRRRCRRRPRGGRRSLLSLSLFRFGSETCKRSCPLT